MEHEYNQELAENIHPKPQEEKVAAKSVSKYQPTILVGDVDKTDRVQSVQLEYSVNTLLSNPQNKRFHEDFDGMSILELFEEMTENLSDEDMVTFSNGTKTTKLSVEDWKSWISMNLSLFDCDDKSPTQNVWIRVSGKSVQKEDIEISTL